MDKIAKVLKKLTKKERGIVKAILSKLDNGSISNFDVKKLKSRDDIFRIRKGDLRIIYQKSSKGVLILAIERRSERTYRDFS